MLFGFSVLSPVLTSLLHYPVTLSYAPHRFHHTCGLKQISGLAEVQDVHSEVVGDSGGKINWSQILEDLGRPAGKFGFLFCRLWRTSMNF